ncbi:MAG: sigma-54-dependent Fis family transcriptional regulator, partial [Acidobacteriales bacterium]|nr:sigma-54-dependent Fis family transcriptional regulator [Terriglobales bacterium]
SDLEISEMHPSLQAKLLHVLQDGTFSRLGGKREISVDVRVIAATNKHIEEAVENGQFREDLFYRLNVITLYIPPLRERREEIPVLLTYFLQRYSEVYGKTPPPFSEPAVEKMIGYAWPGNIRELENLVKRYVIVGNEAQIVRELTNTRPLRSRPEPPNTPPVKQPAPSRTRTEPQDGPSLLEIGRRAAAAAEHEAIERVLQQTRWNRRQAAKILKISYKALLNKLKAMEEARSAQEAGQETT